MTMKVLAGNFILMYFRGYSATPVGRFLVSHWEIDTSVKLLQAQIALIPLDSIGELSSNATPVNRISL